MQSVTEGLVLVMTIVAWEYLINWLAYRFPVLRPYLRPRSLTLVKKGRVVENAMKEMLSMAASKALSTFGQFIFVIPTEQVAIRQPQDSDAELEIVAMIRAAVSALRTERAS